MILQNLPHALLVARARRIYDLALRDGFLVPQVCQVCGELPTGGHHEDYTKPLEVKWLCTKHHAGADRDLRFRYRVQKPIIEILPVRVARKHLALIPILPDGDTLITLIKRTEKEWIEKALNTGGGMQTTAARLLGINYRQFRHLMKKHAFA